MANIWLKALFQGTIYIGNHIQCSFDGLVQDCSNSIANALELLQYCIKPSISFQWYALYIPQQINTYDTLLCFGLVSHLVDCKHDHLWHCVFYISRVRLQ